MPSTFLFEGIAPVRSAIHGISGVAGVCRR
jgi:hypothetical protein